MARTRAIVITGNGTNCETEAAHACRLGGFDEAVIAHIAEIISGEITLDDFHFLNLTDRMSASMSILRNRKNGIPAQSECR